MLETSPQRSPYNGRSDRGASCCSYANFFRKCLIYDYATETKEQKRLDTAISKNNSSKKSDTSAISTAKPKVDYTNTQLLEKVGFGGSGCSVYRCSADGVTCAVKVTRKHVCYLITIFAAVTNFRHRTKFNARILSRDKHY